MQRPILTVAVSIFALAAACAPAPGKDLLSGAPAHAEPTAAEALPAPEVTGGTYAIDPDHKSFTFKMKHLGLGDYVLRFRTFEANVTLDPANPAASSVTASVDPSSIGADYTSDYAAGHPGTRFKSWEDDLANSTRFLNAAAHPSVTFASTAVTQTGARTATVTGDLTLLGVTKPITLNATLTGEIASHPFGKQPAVGLSATGTFKRSDFGLTHLIDGGIVGDDVTVEINGDFILQPPAAE